MSRNIVIKMASKRRSFGFPKLAWIVDIREHQARRARLEQMRQSKRVSKLLRRALTRSPPPVTESARAQSYYEKKKKKSYYVFK